MPTTASPAVLQRIQALLARAADPGATEEERRTSGVIAARLIREHGIELGAPPPTAPAPDAPDGARVVDRFRSVVEVATAGRAGLDQALGFDLFGFAQTLLRDRLQSELERAIKAPAKPRAKARARARIRAKAR